MDTTFSSHLFTKHAETITRLPISPPPEEEIRSKSFAALVELPEDQSYSAEMNQLYSGKNTYKTFASSRKRGRSAYVSPLADSSNVPSNGTSISPNPKPRKQVKIFTSESRKEGAISCQKMGKGSVAGRDGSCIQSPRNKCTDARTEDYVSERNHTENSSGFLSLKKGKLNLRKSLVPSVPYEPPAEQFTPPRSVVRSGTISPTTIGMRSARLLSSGSKRKHSAEPKVAKAKVERLTSPFPLPPLDLSRPVPPPSPTDDPLLLVDEQAFFPLPETPDPSTYNMMKEDPLPDFSSVTGVSPSQFERNSPEFPPITDNLSPDCMDAVVNMSQATLNNASLEISDGAVDPRLTFPWDSPGPTESDVFSLEDEEVKNEPGEAEGEFTGRFKFYKTPIKDDPPSSATKVRRESWGRPISPFPRQLLFSSPNEDHEKRTEDTLSGESPPTSPNDGRGRRHGLNPDAMLGCSGSKEGDIDSMHLVAALEMQLSDANNLENSPAIALSNDSSSRCCGLRSTPTIEGDFDGDSSDDEINSPSIIEVSSSDPRAAARATAILKLHHSYIVGNANVKTGLLRSTPPTLDSAKIADYRGSPEGHNYQQHLVESDGIEYNPQTSYPSSRNILTTENLIPCHDIPRQAHEFITKKETKIPSRCMSVPVSESGYSQLSQGTVAGWTKSHWKKLDTCFTDERYTVAAAMGLPGQMADVSEIQVKAVVDRFINEMEDGDWDYPMLMRRVTALIARQHSGKGAPPSTSLILLESEPFQSRIYKQLGKTQPELDAYSHIPVSLFAPRYVHLREEAVSNNSPFISSTDPIIYSPQLDFQLAGDNTSTRASPDNPIMSYIKPSLIDHSLSISTSAAKRGTLLGYNTGDNAAKKTVLYSHVPALPMPDINRISQAPVTTPAKRLIPKIRPPKDLVRLTETKPMIKEQISSKVKCAKDFVKLRHIEPVVSVQKPRLGAIRTPLRGKRSVKDLVRGFEEVAGQTNPHTSYTADIRKVSSMGNLNTKPVWRP